MSITLVKSFAGSSTYVADHVNNYTLIEDNINALLASVAGSTASLSVSPGLQEIFDRDGVIGIGSYQLTNQTVVADTLTIPAGALWQTNTFKKKASTTALNTAALTTGTRYINVDASGTPSLASSSGPTSIYSFSWNSGTKVISAATLLVSVLFDGTDYADQLTSAALATTYDNVADRFEAIEVTLGILGAFYAQDTGTTSGLDFGYKAGTIRNDNSVSTTAAGTITLPASQTNYIEVTPSTGVVSTNTTGYTTLRVPLFTVTTDGSGITGVVDHRTWASLAGAGGGGHTQNTDTGTDAGTFTLLATQAGTPALNATLAVERGSSANVGIRWNETTDKWEQTTDGTVWTALGAPDLGVQELSKMVTFENPPAVVDITGHTTDSGYVKVDLTLDANFTSIVSGVQGMILRVQYDDSAADASTAVLFRRLENPLFSPAESLRVFARDSAAYDDKQGVTIVVQGEGVDMSSATKIGFEYFATTSGSGTANLKVFVIGYWEKVTGVGTQEIVFNSTGNVVAGSTTVDFDLTGFMNRGVTYNILIQETTGTPTAVYHVSMFTKDSFLSGDLQYSVTDIDPSADFVDYRGIMLRDKDNSAELHLRIQNTDASSGTFDITIEAERMA